MDGGGGGGLAVSLRTGRSSYHNTPFFFVEPRPLKAPKGGGLNVLSGWMAVRMVDSSTDVSSLVGWDEWSTKIEWFNGRGGGGG